jgi:hypothetical protein
LALSSGLLEVTYNAGARVILQGPVTYEVDSAVGGFLSLGKLTARVEAKGSGFRVQGSEGAKSTKYGVLSTEEDHRTASQKSETISKNPSLQIAKSATPPPSQLSTLNSQLFTVRTPTATVTDLGTEFGVEVRDGGATLAHVFRGAVEFQSAEKGTGLSWSRKS